jgi:pyruvate carboxylase
MRLDGGTAYSGAVITPLLRLAAGQGHRLGADRPTRRSARMDRALREFRIRGVATNLQFSRT